MAQSSAGPRGNVLSAASLSYIIRGSLPKASDPQIRTGHEAIAIASHASMLAVGFRMVGLGEDHKLEASSDREEPQELPTEWNANAGSYAFRYKHSQSSMEYLLKVSRMGSKTVIMGMGLGDDKTSTFELKAQEFVSDGNLPATPKKEGTPDAEVERGIQDIFISIGRLSDLGSLLRVGIIQKLAPSLQKPGYEETAESQSSDTRPTNDDNNNNTPNANRPQRDLLRDDRNPDPARPYPLADLSHTRAAQCPNPCLASKTNSKPSVQPAVACPEPATLGSATEISTRKASDPTIPSAAELDLATAAEWVVAACIPLSTIPCSPVRVPEVAEVMIRKSHLERVLIRWDLASEAAVAADTPEAPGWVAGHLTHSEGLVMETSFDKTGSLVGISACTFLVLFLLSQGPHEQHFTIALT
jgi:hypothetical protein